MPIKIGGWKHSLWHLLFLRTPEMWKGSIRETSQMCRELGTALKVIQKCNIQSSSTHPCVFWNNTILFLLRCKTNILALITSWTFRGELFFEICLFETPLTRLSWDCTQNITTTWDATHESYYSSKTYINNIALTNVSLEIHYSELVNLQHTRFAAQLWIQAMMHQFWFQSSLQAVLQPILQKLYFLV